MEMRLLGPVEVLDAARLTPERPPTAPTPSVLLALSVL